MPRRASKKVLTEAQRSAIAEARSIYESRVGERRIMYQSAVAGVSSTFRSRREGAAKMSKSTDLLKLPTSAKTAAARLAKAEGVSLNQFIASAVAEKVGVIGLLAQFVWSVVHGIAMLTIDGQLRDGDESVTLFNRYASQRLQAAIAAAPSSSGRG
jgi:hypothetical protein